MAFTVTVVEAVLVQPLEAVPVTVYVVVDEGVNDTPSLTLLSHEYVLAPPPVKVTELPSQTAEDVVLAVTVGTVVLEVNVILSVSVQPFDEVTVTVYVPSDVGEVLAELPPLLHE